MEGKVNVEQNSAAEIYDDRDNNDGLANIRLNVRVCDYRMRWERSMCAIPNIFHFSLTYAPSGLIEFMSRGCIVLV